MPGKDQSGPQGQGPMTGRGLGDCQGFGESTTQERRWGSRDGMGGGRGRRRCRGGGGGGGRGGGRGRRGGFGNEGGPERAGYNVSRRVQPSRDGGSEEQRLQYQAQLLRGQLKQIESRLGEFETDDAGEKS